VRDGRQAVVALVVVDGIEGCGGHGNEEVGGAWGRGGEGGEFERGAFGAGDEGEVAACGDTGRGGGRGVTGGLFFDLVDEGGLGGWMYEWVGFLLLVGYVDEI
jgi:hypothetical protein